MRQLLLEPAADLVVAERGEEVAGAGQAGELLGGNAPAPARLLPRVRGLRDVAGERHARDAQELDPLGVAHDGDAHLTRSLTSGGRRTFVSMMAAVTAVPPFERFYAENRDAVFAFLRARVGAGADDAFQETFLRALRGYGSLRHGEHLRAWVFTIAARVVTDEHRRGRRVRSSPRSRISDRSTSGRATRSSRS